VQVVSPAAADGTATSPARARTARTRSFFTSFLPSEAACPGCVSTIASIDEIIADPGVAAVFVTTPTDMHADLIEQAAVAGKAIFCEKPIDLSVERVHECLRVVDEQRATLMVGFNRRFEPNFRAARARIDAGEIGDVEMVSITSRDPGPPPLEYMARSGRAPRHDDPRLRHGPFPARRGTDRRDQDCRDLGDATIEPGATERPLTPPSAAVALVARWRRLLWTTAGIGPAGAGMFREER
jgi:hypothetical protein